MKLSSTSAGVLRPPGAGRAAILTGRLAQPDWHSRARIPQRLDIHIYLYIYNTYITPQAFFDLLELAERQSSPPSPHT